MIISHRHGFVFVKTRKTASTSIEIALSQYCGPQDIITTIVEKDEDQRQLLGYPGPQNYHVEMPSGEAVTLVNHSPARAARELLGDKWDDYFVFTLERNPFDRLISQYYWTMGRSGRPIIEFLRIADQELISNWDLYTDQDSVIVDYIGKYEQMTESLLTIGQKLGLGGALSLPETKFKSNVRADRRHYREVLTDEERLVIEHECRRELALFDYSW